MRHWSNITKNYVLKNKEKYRVIFNLKKTEVSRLTEEKKTKILADITKKLVKDNFIVTKSEFKKPCFLVVFGTYEGHSIIASVIIFGIIGILTLLALTQTVQSFSKLSDSPVGGIMSIILLIFLGLLFMKGR